MNLKQIFELPGCKALDDYLQLNFGQTLEDILGSAVDVDDCLNCPDNYDEPLDWPPSNGVTLIKFEAIKDQYTSLEVRKSRLAPIITEWAQEQEEESGEPVEDFNKNFVRLFSGMLLESLNG
jgi:hypothetical protein